MNTPYHTPFSPAPNTSNYPHAPMHPSCQQFPMAAQQFPVMMMPAHMQLQQMQQPMLQPQMPMAPLPGYLQMFYPTHNFPAFRPPFYHINQQPVVPSPVMATPLKQELLAADPATPTTSRQAMRNASLNASLLGGSTPFNASFNESVRFNPLGRGRARDHSLLIDQTTSSSDRSFQQSFIDPREMANNNDLINYCVIELCRKQLTEQELVDKVMKSRRFKRFGNNNLPAAVAIILNTFPCFVSRTVILKTSPNDLQPVSKTLWKSDNRYVKKAQRGRKLNATMFEIPESSSGGGEILSVLGDIASMNLDENKPPTTVASMEKVLEGITF
ncbi:hypothetical protein PENTCL1PPCAC_15001 [Pristionchus entomophagus]|uniref:Uncharacterized protein n=1 Tax=Pristionchus entomophagus TaxID=358040 RepID=A0AAV5TGW0_9BILA|nr:hypothetical protein PENTCL1PPCAC_15001 [Pristionchus entomophagus]